MSGKPTRKLSFVLALLACINIMLPLAQAEQVLLKSAPLKDFSLPNQNARAAEPVNTAQSKPVTPSKPASTVFQPLEPQLEYPANWPAQSQASTNTRNGEALSHNSPTVLNASVEKSANTGFASDIQFVDHPKQKLYNVRVISSSGSLEQNQLTNPFSAATQINSASFTTSASSNNSLYSAPTKTVTAPNTQAICDFCEAVHRMIPPSAYNQAASDPTVANLNNLVNTLRSVLH